MSSSRLPILHVLLALLAAGALRGADELPAELTLQQAVARSLAQNPAVAIQRENVAQRTAQKQQASGEFDTLLSAYYYAGETNQPGVNSNAVTFQSYLQASGVVIPSLTTNLNPFDVSNTTKNNNYTYQLSVSQKLRDGIVITPQASVLASDGVSPPVAAIGNGQLTLDVLVPMLRGLGTDSSGAKEAAARGEIEVARLLYHHSLAEQVLHTSLAYWHYRAVIESLAVRRDTEARAQRLLDSTRGLVDGRVLPPGSLLQTQANLLERRSQRVAAELEVSAAQIEFGEALGLEGAAVAAAPAPSDPFPAPAALSGEIADWCERAFANRADHAAAVRSRDPLAILARKAAHDLLPRLDADMRVGYASLSPGIDPWSALRDRRTGGNASVGLTLDWPLQNRLARGNLNELRSKQRQNEAALAQLGQQIAGEVAAAVREVRLSAELVRAGQAAVAVADRAGQEEHQRLRAGETTLLDVVNLDNQFGAARLQAAEAEAGYAQALARLRFAVGAIFEPGAKEGSLALANLSLVPTP